MRFLRAPNGLTRFLMAAPLFGAALAILIITQYPRSASGVENQNFTNQFCTATNCLALTPYPAVGCPTDINCNFTSTVMFPTCRQAQGLSCVNSDQLYGHIGCSGTCVGQSSMFCSQDIYMCWSDATTIPTPPG